jgi:hypothetical protein
MGNIFEGSYVTLSATAAVDSTHGCFPNRNRNVEKVTISHTDVAGLKSPVHVRPVRGSVAHSWLTTANPDLEQRRKAPTLTRGWCFQERLLASRVVHFAQDEIVFECKSRCRCECGGADPLSFKALYVPLAEAGTPPPNPEEMSVRDLHSHITAISLGLDKQRWRMLVEHYSTRNFTHLRDTLPALSALARRYEGALDDTYLGGLWKSQLPWDLLWYSDNRAECYRPMERMPSDALGPGDNEKDRIYTAPTFSWASRIGPVSWVSSYDSSKPVATITGAKCFPKSHDIFGEVEDGYITIKGPTLPYSVKLFDPAGSPPFTSLLRNSQGSYHFDTREGEGIARKVPLRLLCVLKDEPKSLYRPVHVATALILRRSSARPGTYRRVGILEWCNASIFDEATEMELTIV